MERRLPIGIQSFEKIRRDGFVYVDKTAHVWRLVRAGVPVFLSRPRRFGKSLLVSTMRAYFEGRCELFAGLDIEVLEEGAAAREGREPWVARPVLSLSFNGADYTREGGLERKLDAMLRRWETALDVGAADLGEGDRFLDVIERAHERSGHRVAVLVDEYDKPLLDVMGDEALLDLVEAGDTEGMRDGIAEEALAQIEAMGCAAPFSADPRELHLIGATFDSGTRLLADWLEH
jgi:hypothetical protein